MGNAPLNTLDEPIWDTVKRDLQRIGGNLILVVFPFKNRDQQSAALRNWDLWGPMVRAFPRPVFDLHLLAHIGKMHEKHDVWSNG